MSSACIRSSSLGIRTGLPRYTVLSGSSNAHGISKRRVCRACPGVRAPGRGADNRYWLPCAAAAVLYGPRRSGKIRYRRRLHRTKRRFTSRIGHRRRGEQSALRRCVVELSRKLQGSVGVEAGVSVFDLDGSARVACESLQRLEPRLTFDEVCSRVLSDWEGTIRFEPSVPDISKRRRSASCKSCTKAATTTCSSPRTSFCRSRRTSPTMTT